MIESTRTGEIDSRHMTIHQASSHPRNAFKDVTQLRERSVRPGTRKPKVSSASVRPSVLRCHHLHARPQIITNIPSSKRTFLRGTITSETRPSDVTALPTCPRPARSLFRRARACYYSWRHRLSSLPPFPQVERISELRVPPWAVEVVTQICTVFIGYCDYLGMRAK